MKEAVAYVHSGKPLREAARHYNVPVETLRRRTNGTVTLECKPGPSTVLTCEEEKCLVDYVIEMADRGFGLIGEDIMRIAFTIVDKSRRPHPFQDGMAGRGWLEAFRRRHPELSLRTPQALSYSRAASASKEKVADFFAKLGSLYGRLNLITKPMQVYNIDETGITIVHKPGKVFCAVGRKHVYSITSGEKGKTHTVVVCASASGHVIPPMMIYPRKKAVPESMQNGCVPGTVFETSDNGWITQDIYFKWFKLFIKSIPPARPVLLIEDGHSSHITLDVIELARENGIHLLCLPSHSSHILQPLDIGVFKSFKVHYPKACRKYLMNNPGRVITSEVIASLVCDTWAHSITPVNILGGFKKTGISPFNPSEVDDRMLAPAKVFKPTNDDSSLCTRFSAEQRSLFEKQFNEGYDVQDPLYELWLKEQHPESDSDSMKTNANSLSSNESSLLSEVLKYPEISAKRRRKPAANSSAVCLSDSPAIKQLKQKEEEKRLAEEEKAKKKEEREVKKAERERKKALREKEREEKKKEREEKRKKREEKKKERDRKRLDDDEVSEDDVECPVCHVKESESTCQWICCDHCDVWYHTHCTDISPDDLPDIFYCLKCD